MVSVPDRGGTSMLGGVGKVVSSAVVGMDGAGVGVETGALSVGAVTGAGVNAGAGTASAGSSSSLSMLTMATAGRPFLVMTYVSFCSSTW